MWREVDNKLQRAFEFKDFSEAFAFMTRVAMLAENAITILLGNMNGTKSSYGFLLMIKVM